jgi:ribosomal protein L37AE/L43A
MKPKHWCEECDCEMNQFTDETGRDAWGCDECGWSELGVEHEA